MVRVVTWNLQGRSRPETGAVVDVLAGLRPDVVALQEVQRRQAQAIAGALGWQATWRWKHWPVVVPAEGLAVLAPVPPVKVRHRVLAARWRWWSWRRRIALVADLRTGAGVVRVVDVHLGAHVTVAERRRQAGIAVGLLDDAPGAVAGDLNAEPGDAALEPFVEAGLADAWAVVHGPAQGPTNWRPGPRDAPPTQRLDHVYVQGLTVEDAVVAGGDEAVSLGELSDHLPLSVDVTLPR